MSDKLFLITSSNMYAIIPSDGTRGYLVGERCDVIQLRNKLNELIDNNQCDGEINSTHEQLGRKWLTVDDAAHLILDVCDEIIPKRTIRYACAKNYIKDAEIKGRDWHFPQASFLHWYDNRPKPGRKVDIE